MESKNKLSITAEKGKQEFFIEREFDAPRELVFKAFNEPDILLQWLGPNELEMTIEKMDNRTGGSYRFLHTTSGGQTFAFNGVYHEVFFPERIIRTFEFEGLPERGHVVLEFLIFEALPDERTRIHIQSVFKSVADRDGMLQSDMERGMNEGFDKLDTILITLTQNK